MNLQNLLQKLKAARLIVHHNDEYELTKEGFKLIGEQPTEEEQVMLKNWEKLVREKLNQFQASTQQSFLTTKELEALEPFFYQLELSTEEQQFIEKSQAFRKAESAKKRRRFLLLMLFFAACFFVTTIGLIWSVYQGRTALHQQEQIVKNAYFYLDRFTLCVTQDSSGKLQYGFMDKQGIVRIPYQYDEAANFDEYGFARVKIGETLFLIDTLNNRYPLAESLNALNDKTLALSLKEQYLDVFPPIISTQKQLQILYLRGNFFANLPKDLENLTQLKVLDLGYNNLATLPDHFAAFKELKILDLRNNFLTKFDSALLELPVLEILNLSGNQIEKVPSDIKKLKELKVLNLSNNKIKNIDNITEQYKLRLLNINQNDIDSIPEALVKRTELVINFGGHKMKKQSFNNAYRNDDKTKDSDISNPANTSKRSNLTTEENNPKNKPEDPKQNTTTTPTDNFRYQVLKIAGDNQSASARQQLDDPIKIRVANPYGQALPNIPVHFEVSGGGAVSSQEVISDKDGFAQVFWVMGIDGEQVLTITVKGDSTGKKASNPQIFKAISHYIVDERDGEAYPIVRIGNQVWMAENLRYESKYSKYNPNNKDIRYGRLYDWDALMGTFPEKGLCPKGWHLPSNEEWQTLKKEKTATALKYNQYWDKKNEHLALLNASGFNALPAGKYNRLSNTFSDLGKSAYFWSSTEVTMMYAVHYQLYMHQSGSDIFERNEDVDKYNGFSCRCVKD